MLWLMFNAVRSWPATNSFSHRQFSLETLAREPRPTISVCLPARNEAATIGPILEQLVLLAERGLIDQIVVVDGSSDGTADVARSVGAQVHDQDELLPELGPAIGKGDAMWRALSVLTGELVCFLDADSGHFGAHFLIGLLGPLVCDPAISFVKGFYRRPFRLGDVTSPHGGGRVTELTARPLLNLFYPELAAVEQPLAGEIAARRSLLVRLPFVSGYGVDIALLLDAYGAVGIRGLAQVDLDLRQNAHQPLHDLGPMAFAVLHAVASRVERDGRLRGPLPETFLARGENGLEASTSSSFERPPLATLPSAA